MKVTITIPIYISDELLAEFTEKTVESIKSSHDYEIVIVNNYCKSEFIPRMKKLGTFYNNDENCLSKSWNIGIKHGLNNNSDYIIIPNNDLIFHPEAIDNLVKFAEDHPEFIMWTSAEHIDMRTINSAPIGDSFDEHPHFSCFMISPKTVEILRKKELNTRETYPGLFDEGYKPAYFEDGDYHNRILRAGQKAGKTASSLFYHFGSRTIKVDEELGIKNRRSYETNRAYFRDKWGFDPHNRVTPNDDSIRFKYKEPYGKKVS